MTLLWSAALLVGLPHITAVAGVPRSRRPAGASPTRSSPGSHVIVRDRQLRLIAALCAAQTVVAGASAVYEVSIALDLLDLGESGIGLLGAVLGVGGMLGGFVALVLGARQRIASDFGWAS